jgi:hypothetical protein
LPIPAVLMIDMRVHLAASWYVASTLACWGQARRESQGTGAFVRARVF